MAPPCRIGSRGARGFLAAILAVAVAGSAFAAEPALGGTIHLFVQEIGATRAKVHDQDFALTASWVAYEATFVTPARGPLPPMELGFHVGADAQEIDLEQMRIGPAATGGGSATAIPQLTLTNNDQAVAPSVLTKSPDTLTAPAWHLRIPEAPEKPWSTLVRAPVPIELAPGTTYRVTFRAKGVVAPGQERLPGRVIVSGGNFYCDNDIQVRGVTAADQLLYQSFWYGTISCRIARLPPGTYRLVLGNARTWFGDSTVRTFPVQAGTSTLGSIQLDTTTGPEPQEDSFPLTVITDVELTLPGGRLSFLRIYDAAGHLAAERTALAAMPAGYLAKQRFFFDPAQVAPGKPEAPWPGTYKIAPAETDRLTAADVVGPDGVVYPDFRTAGVPGGIPTGQPPLAARDFGALPNDDLDDGVAIERAAAEAQRLGGAAILLEAGTYQLDQPVRIGGNGVVIRGAGVDRTRVEFRLAPVKGRIRFTDVTDGMQLHTSDAVEIEVAHTDLASLTVTRTDDHQIIRTGPVSLGDGGRFQVVFRGYELAKKATPGPVTLLAQATWTDGTAAEARITLDISPRHPARTRPPATGAFVFRGAVPPKPTVTLTADAARGATVMTLSTTTGLKPGDIVLIDTPPNPAFLQRLRTTCPYLPRQAMMEIQGVQGSSATLSQPLRTSWSAGEGTTVVKIEAIRGCGVEDLTIEQSQPLWTSLIDMQYAVGCWVTRTRLLRAGQHPVRMDHAKWCTISDTVMTDAWFKGGGGTAYAGFFSFDWDCLMEGVTTRALRHAPCIQWASAGNVIRNSTFIGSDLQWHAGLALENLVENCVIDGRGKQSYGWAMYASVPEAAIHGPSGPRNVVYGNDITAKNGGIMMGGMNEGWLIIGNRIHVERSMALVAKDGSFDHLIRGNVFWLDDAFGQKAMGPAILLASADCTGIDLIDNAFLGATPPLIGGPAATGIVRGNRLLERPDQATRPTLAMPSLYAWQRSQIPPSAPPGPRP